MSFAALYDVSIIFVYGIQQLFYFKRYAMMYYSHLAVSSTAPEIVYQFDSTEHAYKSGDDVEMKCQANAESNAVSVAVINIYHSCC